jgi:tetratricopeptide (TPR) repeat protein
MADAVSYLERAVQVDPNFAKAHAALSRALLLWTFYQWAPAPPDAVQRAEASAYRALAIDPQSSEAHAALGTLFRHAGNLAGATGEYKRALEINPNNAAALWDFIILLDRDPATAGDPAAEAQVKTLTDRYARLDPRSPILWQSKVSEASEGVGDTVPVVVQNAVAMLADDVDGLRLVGLEARRTGYALEAYRVSLAIEKAGDTQTAVFLAIRTWLLVDDYERARRTAEALGRVGDAETREAAAYFLGEIAALSGDYTTWARYADLDPNSTVATCGPETAFWLAIQERYAEGANHLDGCNPVPEGAMGGLGAGLLGQSQLLPAMLRIYRATGRGAEANALAQEYLTKLRQDKNPFSRLDLAALAANEGLKDEAVDALSTLLEQYPLVDFFSPRLPWFRSLEGHPGYDQLIAERSRRIDKARAEMLQLEANAEGSVLQLR